MFTGIIESLGKITNVKADRGNIDFTIESEISKELKIDQSVSHNGVCLTVTSRETIQPRNRLKSEYCLI